MTVYGEADRPRVLYIRGPASRQDHESVLRPLVGNLHVNLADGVFNARTIAVRWPSWDAVVLVGCVAVEGLPDHLRVLQVGGIPVGSWKGFINSSSAAREATALGEELDVPEGLEPESRLLIKSSVLPLIREQLPPRQCWRLPESAEEGARATTATFLSDLDGHMFAARYTPDFGPDDVVYLPQGVDDDPEAIKAWAVWCLTQWSEADSDRFPELPDWRNDPEWRFPAERAAAEQVDTAKRALETAIATHEAAVKNAEAELYDVAAQVDATWRRLLTSTGDDLVGIVATAFERLGFSVTNMDDAGTREKREDLRVEEGDWLALVEVKGYAKGASPRDLHQLHRFAGLFVQETKGERQQDSLWYVCNQFRERDPRHRREILRGQDDDVNGFADSRGLVIDTRALYRLIRDVDAGKRQADEARQLLFAGVGRFSYQPLD
ncbi:hypothetical protein [Gordonia sp. FQ]|uniref:hypothetical protein n=1 Tax=Gordonia sp. FQ TaxID=3446634 RepID=UPI003F82C428